MARRIISGTRMNRFPTRDFNDAVEHAQSRFHSEMIQGGGALGGIVKIRNNSGTAVDEGGPLGIDALMVEHADNEPEFRRMPGFLGVEPDSIKHAMKWVIAEEPIAEDQIGRAVYRGLCVARVDVRNKYHTHARYRRDRRRGGMHLCSDFGGLARIVAQPDATGWEWCQLDMRADSAWEVEGFLADSLAFASVNGAVMDSSVAEGAVWQRNALGQLATDTKDTVTVENVSSTTAAPAGAYFIARFDGFAWRQVWLDCLGSGLGV